MSQFRRESFFSALFLGLSILIQYLNILFLIPRVLQPAQYGLTQLLITIASTLCLFGQLGLRSVTIRYFPYFRDEKTAHHSYLSFLLLTPLLGVVLVFLFAFGLKDWLITVFQSAESNDLINNYYFWVFPLTFFLIYFEVLGSYAAALFRPSVPVLFRDVFTKLGILVLLLLFWQGYFGFPVFVAALILLHGLQGLGLIGYLMYIGEWRIAFDWSKFTPKLLREMFVYGFFTLSSGSVMYVLEYIDRLMVSVMSAGELADGGIYSILCTIGLVVYMPGKAITTAALPVIADAWQRQDLHRIESVYRKTSLLQLILGGLVCVGIWINRHHVVSMLGTAYEAGKYVPILVGLSQLADLATGINGGIIATSRHFKFQFYFNLFLLILTVFTNYLFIPLYGLTGAAFANLLTMVIYNFGKGYFVWHTFRMQPFTKKTLWVLLLLLLLVGVDYLLPTLPYHFVVDLLFRSFIITALFGGLILYFRVSEDINELVARYWKRVFGGGGR